MIYSSSAYGTSNLQNDDDDDDDDNNNNNNVYLEANIQWTKYQNAFTIINSDQNRNNII